jgi:hypothetical protein
VAQYAVRVLMHEAALQADLDPDRLSFVHPLETVCDAVPEFQQVPPSWREDTRLGVLQLEPREGAALARKQARTSGTRTSVLQGIRQKNKVAPSTPLIMGDF